MALSPQDPDQTHLKKFNTEHWEQTLIKVFTAAATNEEYRQLCLRDPRRAVAGIAPDLDLPPDFQFSFVTDTRQIHSFYLLPPTLQRPECKETVEQLISWGVLLWTNPPTPPA